MRVAGGNVLALAPISRSRKLDVPHSHTAPHQHLAPGTMTVTLIGWYP